MNFFVKNFKGKIKEEIKILENMKKQWEKLRENFDQNFFLIFETDFDPGSNLLNFEISKNFEEEEIDHFNVRKSLKEIVRN